MIIPSPIRGIATAFVFLTRVPLRGSYTPSDWRWAPAHFPLVGVFVGLVSGGVWFAVERFGAWPAAVFAVISSVLITGAFHEDGLADSADALGGGLEDRARIFEVLKDSRLGTYGSAALILSLMLRIALIQALGQDVIWGLVLAHGLARFPPVVLMAALPYATEEPQAKSRDLANAGRAQVLTSAAWAVTIAILSPMSLSVVAVALAAMATATVILGVRFRARVGGIAGDFLGATEQICEITVLMVLIAAWT